MRKRQTEIFIGYIKQGAIILAMGVGFCIAFVVATLLLAGLTSLIGFGWALFIATILFVLYLMWSRAGYNARVERETSFYVNRKEKV